MALRGTDPESYITEYTSVYDIKFRKRRGGGSYEDDVARDGARHLICLLLEDDLLPVVHPSVDPHLQHLVALV